MFNEFPSPLPHLANLTGVVQHRSQRPDEGSGVIGGNRNTALRTLNQPYHLGSRVDRGHNRST
jgi:hypothetical protein